MIQKAGEKLLSGIERVRSKPETTRWAIVIAITLICAAVLITFWITTLPKRFESIAQKKNQNRAGASQARPFTGLFESITKSWKALRSGESPEAIAAALKAEAEAAEVNLKVAEAAWYSRWWGKTKETLAFNVLLIWSAIKDLGK